MDVKRSSAAAPSVPTPPPPCDPLPVTPALPKEVVDCVPANWGGVALRTATPKQSRAALTEEQLQGWPEQVLEHEARALGRSLQAPGNYPGRQVDAANFALVESELHRRVSAERESVSRVARPTEKEAHEVEHLVKEAGHAAEKLAHEFAKDSPIRQQYVDGVRQQADRIVAAFERGEISGEEAAAMANRMRNDALGMARGQLTPAGKALSKLLKEEGLTLAQACDKQAEHLFGREFITLSAEDRAAALVQVAERAGATNAYVNFGARHASKAGKALLAVTLAIAIYQVATAEDKAREATKQIGGLVGTVAGAKAGAGIVMTICAATGVGVPALPACGLVGALAGGLVGALAGEHYADEAYSAVRGEAAQP